MQLATPRNLKLVRPTGLLLAAADRGYVPIGTLPVVCGACQGGSDGRRMRRPPPLDGMIAGSYSVGSRSSGSGRPGASAAGLLRPGTRRWSGCLAPGLCDARVPRSRMVSGCPHESSRATGRALPLFAGAVQGLVQTGNTGAYPGPTNATRRPPAVLDFLPAPADGVVKSSRGRRKPTRTDKTLMAASVVPFLAPASEIRCRALPTARRRLGGLPRSLRVPATRAQSAAVGSERRPTKW